MPTVFCDCGTAWLTRILNQTDVVTGYYIGWGTGTTAASKNAVGLSTEVQSRIVTANSIAAFNQMQWISTITATADIFPGSCRVVATAFGADLRALCPID